MRTQSTAREILSLAVPAFFTLIAEPLFLLVDTSIIGHLGTTDLAGLGVASAALLTVVNLCVFLAYSTTGVVARAMGAGDRSRGISAGLDGVWLAIVIGAVLSVLVGVYATWLCGIFGASPAALERAATYLRISAWGLTPMLVILAATGLLRGLQDTRTPLIVATAGFVVNLILNVTLVWGLHYGIAGSALGTVLTQWAMALVLCTAIVRAAYRESAQLCFNPAGVLTAARLGVPLLIRTLALRAVLLLTTWVAAHLGDVPLAGHQIAMTWWTFLAFALDALAIAAQALVGRWLGAGDQSQARHATSTMVRWGCGYGVLLGIITILLSPVLPTLFTTDPAVRGALTAALIVVGCGQPIAGAAFILDGVLIGAGDGKWLAYAQVAMLTLYIPVAWLVHLWAPQHSAPIALMTLWCAFLWFMTLRAGFLWWRSKGDSWLRVGI
ncbi:MAG: MATE family efflux transporter [Propionibacteriaceae bacterium]